MNYANNEAVAEVFVIGGNGVAIKDTTGGGVGTGSTEGSGDDVEPTPVRVVVTLPISMTSSACAMLNTLSVY